MVKSHGSGEVVLEAFAACGDNVVFEPGALVFHPENIELGSHIYVGHYAILKGYFKNKLRIGDNTWIGQYAFMHAAGGLTIGRAVGIGPGAKIITSKHDLPPDPNIPVMEGELQFAPVVLDDGCDLGIGSIILPGVRVGKGAQVGAGAVVTRAVPDGAIVSGVPAQVVGHRGE